MSRAADIRAFSGVRSGKPGEQPLVPLVGYFQRSQAPLHSLLLLLPLVILYEAGTVYFATDTQHHTEQRILAFQMMQQFFIWWGAKGRYLPACAVCTIMLSWHIARRDAWEIDWPTLAAMFLESIFWSLPLIILDALSSHYIPMTTGHGHWSTMVVMSIGAGVYEELVFRLALFSVLSLLIVDLLRTPRRWAIPLMVLISGLSFSLYHYWRGAEAFSTHTFVFRTIAGIYFSFLFFWRGFGITAGSHAAYDLIAVTRMVMVAVT
jgi:membrane protease YdiL (CAAX protease family)